MPSQNVQQFGRACGKAWRREAAERRLSTDAGVCTSDDKGDGGPVDRCPRMQAHRYMRA